MACCFFLPSESSKVMASPLKKLDLELIPLSIIKNYTRLSRRFVLYASFLWAVFGRRS